MKKIILFILTVSIFLSAPAAVYAQCSETVPFQCCDEDSGGGSGCDCYNSPGCNDLEDKELISCEPGYCTGEACRVIARNMEISVSYFSIIRACVDFENFLNISLQWAVLLGGLIALVKFGLAALAFVLSTGDPTKLEKARTDMLYAASGLLIIAISYAILRIGGEFVPESWNVWFGTG